MDERTVIDRRRVLCAMAAAPILSLAPRRAVAQGAGRKLHALIVGVDTYTGRIGVRVNAREVRYSDIQSLRGCVNDAREIEQSVRPVAASIRLLLNENVSRASFLENWNAMVRQSSPDDTLLVTYSGHGGLERGTTQSQTADGQHSTFIMPGMDASSDKLRGERLLNDEMQSLWLGVQGRNRVIFVADSCHSGSMTRSVDGRLKNDVRFRTVYSYDVEGDLAAAIPIPTAKRNLELPHVLFLSGAQHDELVPEVAYNGRPHGALSVSFAAAIRGLADENGDGIVTGGELSSYVLRSIRSITESNQHLKIVWPNADVRTGVALDPASPIVPVAAGTRIDPAANDDGGPLKLRIIGDAPVAPVKRVQLVDTAQPPDLVWDVTARQVLNKFGNVLASDIGAEDIQGAIDATRLTEFVKRKVLQKGFDMRLVLPGETPGATPSQASDRTHVEGKKLLLTIGAVKFAHFAAFNLAGDGTIQLLYPIGSDPKTIDPAKPPSWPIVVSPPFGADRAIALNSPRPMDGLVAQLTALNGKKINPVLVDEVARIETALFGMQSIYSAGRV